jgi:hypothetical protein
MSPNLLFGGLNAWLLIELISRRERAFLVKLLDLLLAFLLLAILRALPPIFLAEIPYFFFYLSFLWTVTLCLVLSFLSPFTLLDASILNLERFDEPSSRKS